MLYACALECVNECSRHVPEGLREEGEGGTLHATLPRLLSSPPSARPPVSPTHVLSLALARALALSTPNVQSPALVARALEQQFNADPFRFRFPGTHGRARAHTPLPCAFVSRVGTHVQADCRQAPGEVVPLLPNGGVGGLACLCACHVTSCYAFALLWQALLLPSPLPPCPRFSLCTFPPS